MADKPHFVFRDGMTADRDYVQWIADIKSRNSIGAWDVTLQFLRQKSVGVAEL